MNLLTLTHTVIVYFTSVVVENVLFNIYWMMSWTQKYIVCVLQHWDECVLPDTTGKMSTTVFLSVTSSLVPKRRNPSLCPDKSLIPGWTSPGCFSRECFWQLWRRRGCSLCPWRRCSARKAVCDVRCDAPCTFGGWTLAQPWRHTVALFGQRESVQLY